MCLASVEGADLSDCLPRHSRPGSVSLLCTLFLDYAPAVPVGNLQADRTNLSDWPVQSPSRPTPRWVIVKRLSVYVFNRLTSLSRKLDSKIVRPLGLKGRAYHVTRAPTIQGMSVSIRVFVSDRPLRQQIAALHAERQCLQARAFRSHSSLIT